MKVLLRQDVEGLGRRGEVCDVADGYFRNLLLPRGLAMRATKGMEAQAEAMRRASILRAAKSHAEAEEVAARLEPMLITIPARAAKGGRLFGSVSALNIAEAIQDQADAVVVPDCIQLEAPLKEVGTTTLTCKLQDEVEFSLNVEVVAQ